MSRLKFRVETVKVRHTEVRSTNWRDTGDEDIYPYSTLRALDTYRRQLHKQRHVSLKGRKESVNGPSEDTV